MTNAETVVARILARENMPTPEDPGDGTGLNGAGSQTQPWLSMWSLPFPHNEAEAAANVVVWLAKTGLLAVVNTSIPLGDATADYCYNVSLRGGIKALQSALDVTPDGVIGPLTIAALHAYQGDLSGLVRDVAISRLKALAQGVATFQTKPTEIVGLVERAVSFL